MKNRLQSFLIPWTITAVFPHSKTQMAQVTLVLDLELGNMSKY